MLTKGQVLNGDADRKWLVEAYLGSGVCCDVYKVTLLSSERKRIQAAAKVFKEGEVYSAACNREHELLYLVKKVKGQLKHLVSVMDKFTWLNRACIVEELFHCDLSQIVTKNKEGLSFHMTKVLAKEILCGLSELHTLGFVHGDIKPSNIMWNSESQTLKIIDFSLSFHTKDKNVPKLQSHPYRSPEVQVWNDYLKQQTTRNISGIKDTPSKPSVSCDMWSFGCVCLYILTGEVFFTSDRLTALNNVVNSENGNPDCFINEEIDSVIRDNTNYSCLFKDLVSGCLTYQPDKRLTTSQCMEHSFFR